MKNLFHHFLASAVLLGGTAWAQEPSVADRIESLEAEVAALRKDQARTIRVLTALNQKLDQIEKAKDPMKADFDDLLRLFDTSLSHADQAERADYHRERSDAQGAARKLWDRRVKVLSESEGLAREQVEAALVRACRGLPESGDTSSRRKAVLRAYDLAVQNRKDYARAELEPEIDDEFYPQVEEALSASMDLFEQAVKELWKEIRAEREALPRIKNERPSLDRASGFETPFIRETTPPGDKKKQVR